MQKAANIQVIIVSKDFLHNMEKDQESTIDCQPLIFESARHLVSLDQCSITNRRQNIQAQNYYQESYDKKQMLFSKQQSIGSFRGDKSDGER